MSKKAGTARDREMGREDQPLGDLGHGNRTWTPPAERQGISNRAGDTEEETDGELDEFADMDDENDADDTAPGDKTGTRTDDL
jgi:hypothetical protein